MSTSPTIRMLRGAHDYLNPLDLQRLIIGEKIIGELAATKAFHRLKKIRFLGAIDYVLVRAPNKDKQRYTRYQHSLGVAELSRRYADLIELSYADRQLVCISALLHDIGHAPLSHSLESVFFEHFGIDHHRATEDIVAGRVAIGYEIYDTLKWHGIDVERVLAMIDGQDTSFHAFFSGPINFDTVEGILRTVRYVVNAPTATHPYAVIHAATKRCDATDRQIVDGFWMQKDFVYKKVINSQRGIVADRISQTCMREHIGSFSKNDFFEDEDYLFKKIPMLRKSLNDRNFLNNSGRFIDYPITYNRREFFINEDSAFQERQDTSRYHQRKSPALLLPRRVPATHAAVINRDLFDDETV